MRRGATHRLIFPCKTVSGVEAVQHVERAPAQKIVSGSHAKVVRSPSTRLDRLAAEGNSMVSRTRLQRITFLLPGQAEA